MSGDGFLSFSDPEVKPDLSNAWKLISVRGIRSLNQAFLNVVTPLYLLSRGVSPTELGALFTSSFFVGAGLSVPVGVLADRWGRKPFLVAFTILMLFWGVAFTFSSNLALLIGISVLSGIGRGGGGMGGGQAGPFAPAESALLSDVSSPRERRRVFSWNGVVSSLLAAVGAALAGLPVLLKPYHVILFDSNRGLFVLTIVLAVVSLLILKSVNEPPRRPRAAGTGRILSVQARKIVTYQAVVGVFNSFGISFVNSLFVVWLHLRFGAGQESIGRTYD